MGFQATSWFRWHAIIPFSYCYCSCYRCWSPGWFWGFDVCNCTDLSMCGMLFSAPLQAFSISICSLWRDVYIFTNNLFLWRYFVCITSCCLLFLFFPLFSGHSNCKLSFTLYFFWGYLEEFVTLHMNI